MQCTHNKQKSLAAEEMALFNTCISERGRERDREREKSKYVREGQR